MKFSMYPEEVVAPMRQELEEAGFTDLRSAPEVDAALGQDGPILVVVNSICGCAAGVLRPGVVHAVKNTSYPMKLMTVFAGQDKDATEQARSYLIGYPPSSPCVALLKDKKVMFMLPRERIQGRSSQDVSTELTQAFEKYCS